MQRLINLSEATAGYGTGEAIFTDVSLGICERDFIGLIGPNGCGKSTLIRSLAGALPLRNGTLSWFDSPAFTWKRRLIARRIAVVPQQVHNSFDFTVHQVVSMGRNPYLLSYRGLQPEDLRAVDEAMERTDVNALADRSVLELSGGERQRVVIARALAQQPSVLLLDEPTSYLDINHQIEVFDVLYHLNQDCGLAIFCATHELNMVTSYCRDVVVMKNGRICTKGKMEEAMSDSVLSKVFGIDLKIDTDIAGSLRVVPMSLRTKTSN
ncbi:MAG: ABC transporter ATP-binding protein [Candidatus Latescibacterota bacterium]|nr:ABC transporter ATP-binding protein [Candidatus Latescibacterota bacterium]